MRYTLFERRKDELILLARVLLMVLFVVFGWNKLTGITAGTPGDGLSFSAEAAMPSDAALVARYPSPPTTLGPLPPDAQSSLGRFPGMALVRRDQGVRDDEVSTEAPGAQPDREQPRPASPRSCSGCSRSGRSGSSSTTTTTTVR